MKTPLDADFNRQGRAFALVEIVFATGLVAFTLMAILGLLSVSMLSSKNSTEDTAVANIANYVLSDMRARDFSEFINPITSQAVTQSDVYFDAGGKCLLSGTSFMDRSSALAAGAIYQCKRAFEVSPIPNSDGSVNPYGQRLVKVTLAFLWPANASPPPNAHVIYATLAQY